MKRLVKEMRDKRSVLFIARNLRLTSQKLASAMTATPCMGGSAWATLVVDDPALATPYCLWLNSTLGLLMMWQYGGKQHKGRARMTMGDIKKFPCPAFLDKTTAARRAVKIAKEQFPRLAKMDLMPCSYTWRDDSRKQIDAVVLRMLNLEKQVSEQDMQALREAWCREPSVHGGKKEILKALYKDGLM